MPPISAIHEGAFSSNRKLSCVLSALNSHMIFFSLTIYSDFLLHHIVLSIDFGGSHYYFNYCLV